MWWFIIHLYLVRETREKDREAEKERLWKKHAKDHPDPQLTPFNEKPFGLPSTELLYPHTDCAVSIGLFSGDYSATNKLVDFFQVHIHSS